MSAQRLGAKKIRELEAIVGEPILRAWAHGGTGGWFAFVTPDHRHGDVQRPTRTVEWTARTARCYSSCRDTTWIGGSDDGNAGHDEHERAGQRE